MVRDERGPLTTQGRVLLFVVVGGEIGGASNHAHGGGILNIYSPTPCLPQAVSCENWPCQDVVAADGSRNCGIKEPQNLPSLNSNK